MTTQKQKVYRSAAYLSVYDIEYSVKCGWSKFNFGGKPALTNGKVILTYQSPKNFSLNKTRKFL